jgi:hypothetical protein
LLSLKVCHAGHQTLSNNGAADTRDRAHSLPFQSPLLPVVPQQTLRLRHTRIGDRSAIGREGTDVILVRSRNGAMTSVQIKDVPEHTHAVLRQRAAQAHQSLQEYLRTKLIQEASTPTVEEVLDRASGRAGGRVPIKTATEILREDRDRR